jgi:2-octaprenyl-6-methoxyphenol hydroxylase
MKVALIEALPQAAAASRQQVYALTLLTGQIFEQIGVWDKILPKINKFTQIRLSDADHSGIVQFYPSDLNRDHLGYVAEHGPMISELQAFLNDCPNVNWICPAEVVKVDYQPDAVLIETRSLSEGNSGNLSDAPRHKIRVRLLVAADGKKSPIREAAGISTKGWKYWQSCITTKIKPEKSHNNIAYEKFQYSGPFAILPLPGNRCNVVWTAPHGEAKALAELDDLQFLAELKKRYGDQMGELELLGNRFVFQVQLMQSDRYVKHRLALIGDAAHCCHPVGGQGLNMGIRDVGAIAQVLINAHKKGEDIGSETVLKRYERWRKLENLTILGFTDFLDRMFSNKWLPLIAMRRMGLWLLRNVPALKLFALRLMTGQTGRHPQLAQR